MVRAHFEAPRRPRQVLPLIIAALGSNLSCGAVVQRQVKRLARSNPQVLYRVDTRSNAVALTIDDGPDPVTTARILDVLQRNGARATFFLIGSRVPGNEELLRRMLREKHELGNHMMRDEPSIELSPEEFDRQLLDSHELLSGFAPIRWFRPGSGRFDARMLAALERYGYACALGSAYPFDPQIRWSWFSRQFIVSNARPGGVIILHDWGSKGRRTVKTLSALLPALAKRGFRVVTLTELLALRDAAPATACGS
jgi:peptidoglycan/xylan/chitin deacetylase (PgdA/CDA1 family)